MRARLSGDGYETLECVGLRILGRGFFHSGCYLGVDMIEEGGRMD